MIRYRNIHRGPAVLSTSLLNSPPPPHSIIQFIFRRHKTTMKLWFEIGNLHSIHCSPPKRSICISQCTVINKFLSKYLLGSLNTFWTPCSGQFSLFSRVDKRNGRITEIVQIYGTCNLNTISGSDFSHNSPYLMNYLLMMMLLGEEAEQQKEDEVGVITATNERRRIKWQRDKVHERTTKASNLIILCVCGGLRKGKRR